MAGDTALNIYSFIYILTILLIIFYVVEKALNDVDHNSNGNVFPRHARKGLRISRAVARNR